MKLDFNKFKEITEQLTSNVRIEATDRQYFANYFNSIIQPTIKHSRHFSGTENLKATLKLSQQYIKDFQETISLEEDLLDENNINLINTILDEKCENDNETHEKLEEIKLSTFNDLDKVLDDIKTYKCGCEEDCVKCKPITGYEIESGTSHLDKPTTIEVTETPTNSVFGTTKNKKSRKK